jgi:multidrug efflux pump subunit AcrA (membrane-fusion protein)
LPDEGDTYVLYTVKGDRAVKHTVRIGLQSGDDVQILADDLKAGDPVVITGNYLLTDGMQVEVRESAGGPSATTRATTEPEVAP